jgi:16S rRNA (cytosine967-C5)-methyltransferase
MNPRRAALDLLSKTFKNEGYSNYLYEGACEKNSDWTETDRKFLKALFFGVLRNLVFLDHVAASEYRGNFEKLPENIKLTLRIGTYQIISMDKVPHYAAINESVNIAKKLGHLGTSKLVNAVLRNISRRCIQNPSYFMNIFKDDLPTATSHPDWLVNKYIAEYGLEQALAILTANNELPSQNLRVMDWPELEAATKWGQIHIDKNLFNGFGASITSPSMDVLETLKRKGVIAPQDQSSLIAASLFDGKGGIFLELCCGRGNKTAILVRSLDKNSFLIASDRSLKKLSDMKKVLGETSLMCARVCCDITSPFPFKAVFQTVFLDAPCSGLGVVRRHPEIRYRISQEKIEQMAKIQLKAFSNACTLLKTGGTLLYSVCSFEKEETTTLVGRFLQDNPNFSKVDIANLRPDLDKAGLVTNGFLRILTGTLEMDGFFATILRRDM